MLNEIKDALESLGLPICYGQAGTLDGEDPWDYVVFFRNSTSPNATKRSLTDDFTVAIVQEDFVSESIITDAVKAVCSIPGVRLASSGISYEYTRKPSTSATVEVALIGFVKPSKVCPDGY